MLSGFLNLRLANGGTFSTHAYSVPEVPGIGYFQMNSTCHTLHSIQKTYVKKKCVYSVKYVCYRNEAGKVCSGVVQMEHE